MLTNLTYFVYPLGYPFGNGILPNFVKKSRSIIGLETNPRTNKLYDDNLCLFRALACHYNGGRVPLEVNVEALFKKWCQKENIEISIDEFRGVGFYEFPRFEKHFEINLNVYQLKETDTAIPVYRTLCHFQDSLYVNLFETHLSYIKNFKAYAKKYECSRCSKLFNKVSSWKRHLRSCSYVTKSVYPGGFVKNNKTVFEELEGLGIKVPEKDQTFPYFIVFDFESILKKVQIKTSEKLEWTQKHEPIAVSVCSNVPNFTEPKSFVNEDLDHLLSDMISYMLTISDATQPLLQEKWKDAIEQLKGLLKDYGQTEIPLETANNENERCEWLNNSDIRDDEESEGSSDEFLDFIDDSNTNKDYNTMNGVDYVNVNRQLDLDDSQISDANVNVGVDNAEINPNTNDDDDPHRFIRTMIAKVQNNFKRYCSQIPVLSFNGSFYEMKLTQIKASQAFETRQRSPCLCYQKK